MIASANARYGSGSTLRPEATTDQVLTGLDLAGQLILVTGGTSGLGFETARALAAHNAKIVITARSEAKGEAACKQLREETGKDQIDFGVLELGSLNSIKQFAMHFLSKHPKLNVLINNAGVMACPQGQTEDGFELQFGSNHLGHFVLSELLVPALISGAPSRVVSLSSRGHVISDVNFDDPNFQQRPYHKWIAYGQAKTANSLFAVEFNRRYSRDGVEAFAVHPGAIMTDLVRHMSEEDFDFLAGRGRKGSKPMPQKSVPEGAATSVWAATSEDLRGKGGAYLEDASIAVVNDDPSQSGGVRSYAIDMENARRLWDLSADLVGLADLKP